MSFLRKKRVFALLFITFLLFLFANSNMLGKWMYPVRYQQHIDASSQTYGVDRFLIASIIRVESNFRPDRTSPKGAVGLMQIMPDTAEWIMELDDVPPPKTLNLDNPRDNILIGTRYIKWLLQQYDGNIVKALAAYNAGPGNVNKWLASGAWDGTFEQADRIPFGETRHYIHRVNYYYKKYAQIYKNGW